MYLHWWPILKATKISIDLIIYDLLSFQLFIYIVIYVIQIDEYKN